MSFIASILSLSFLIFFHELGHFLFARIFGVGVTTFSIGFGKKIFSFHHKNTEYAISIIPIGGYVQLNGLKNGIKDLISHDSLYSKHPIKKILILLAGSFFNFLLAFIVFLFLAMYSAKIPSNEPIIGNIYPQSKAFNVLQKNDTIKYIDGVRINTFLDISEIKKDEKNNLSMIVYRNGKEQLINVELTYINGKKIIGIEPIFTKPTFFLSFKMAIDKTNYEITHTFDYFSKLIIKSIGLDQMSSVIGITDVGMKAFENNFVFFLLIFGIISVNLGIINLFPIPMLDGGQIIFVLYEWIFKKEINKFAERILIGIGIFIIMFFMAIGILNDINRLMH